jgi:calmodulin
LKSPLVSYYFQPSVDYLAVDLKEIFTIYDTEATGNVSLTRLGDLLRSSGLNPTEKQIKELVDSKGGLTGSIDFEAFKAVHGMVRDGERPSGEEMEEFRMAMKAFDHDGTGMISIEELKGGTNWGFKGQCSDFVTI